MFHFCSSDFIASLLHLHLSRRIYSNVQFFLEDGDSNVRTRLFPPLLEPPRHRLLEVEALRPLSASSSAALRLAVDQTLLETIYFLFDYIDQIFWGKPLAWKSLGMHSFVLVAAAAEEKAKMTSSIIRAGSGISISLDVKEGGRCAQRDQFEKDIVTDV